MILFFIINLSPNIKNNHGGGLGCYTIYNVVFISSKKKKKKIKKNIKKKNKSSKIM